MAKQHNMPEDLYKIRHSQAHIMAESVLERFPEAKPTIGPPVENGFYYDFFVEKPFTPEDMQAFETRMKSIIKSNAKFTRREVSETEALELLLAEDPAVAARLAASLDARNSARQSIERGMAEEVVGALRARFDPATDYVIVEGQLLWHVGVVGIVASRVLQEFYRPTIILGATVTNGAAQAGASKASISLPPCGNAAICWSVMAATRWRRA